MTPQHASPSSPPKLLVIGAHPDDAEFHAGALMAIYRERNWPVKVISATQGDAGHHLQSGPELASRRAGELRAALAVIGAECEIWPHRDAWLEPSLDLRSQVIGAIRLYQPDLVLTHRTCDYHPDHRAVAQAVQDASYLVTVPPAVPEVPALRRDPVVAFLTDPFTRPVPLRPDVLVPADDQMELIVDMIHCHTSQVYEWLPYNRCAAEPPPAPAEEERKAWLRRETIEPRWAATADRFREDLKRQFGAERGSSMRFAEAFEISEYASPLTLEARRRLFPFCALSRSGDYHRSLDQRCRLTNDHNG